MDCLSHGAAKAGLPGWLGATSAGADGWARPTSASFFFFFFACPLQCG